MKKITVYFTKEKIMQDFEHENSFGFKRQADGFRIDSSSNTRVYITCMNGDMKVCRIGKKMNFDNGEVFLKFGKDKVKIGTYKEE